MQVECLNKDSLYYIKFIKNIIFFNLLMKLSTIKHSLKLAHSFKNDNVREFAV